MNLRASMKVIISITMASLLARGNPTATIGFARLGVFVAMWFTHFIMVAEGKTQKVAAPTRVKFHMSAKSMKCCYYDSGGGRSDVPAPKL